MKSQKKFRRKPIKSNSKEINVMAAEEITTTTVVIEQEEMTETIIIEIEIIVIIGATKTRIGIKVKSSSRKINLVTTVHMEAVVKRREITIKQREQVVETAIINSKMKRKKKRSSNTKPSLIKKWLV